MPITKLIQTSLQEGFPARHSAPVLALHWGLAEGAAFSGGWSRTRRAAEARKALLEQAWAQAAAVGCSITASFV
jgi:hypothetical protein